MAQYEVTLRDYWRILRRRKSIVIFTALLLGFFSFVMATVWKPVPLYKAGTKVQISSNQTLTGIYLEAISYNVGDQIETQQAIIVSFPVLKRAGVELGLFAHGDTAQVILDLQQRISSYQEGYTNIIVIEATDPSPQMAKELANTVARVYQEYNHEQKNQQAVKHRKFVEEQREKAREALAEAEEQVRIYREETDLVSLEAQASVMLGQITEGDKEATRLEQTIRDIDVMLQEMEKGRGLTEKTMQGASKLQVGEAFMNLTYQLNNLKLDRDGLLVQFTKDHPKVAQLQAKIDQLTRNLVDELQQRRNAVVRDREGLRGRLEKLHRDYNQLPSRGLKLARLEREVTLRQEVVSVLEEEYQNALIREADKVEEVAVLQWAIRPMKPINPNNPPQRAAMGVVLGIILGVVFAVIAETLDTSIGTIEDVQEYTGTQVLGVIPFIQLDEVEESLERRGQVGLDRATLQRKAQLVAYFDPQSTLAETFRTLRTNIEFVSVEKGVRTLMVSSSTSQEGKSTVMANVAMTMAQLGKRTLLIDCDLRKPTVAHLFGLDREPGLAEVIIGNYQWRDVVRTVTDIVTGGMGMEDITQTQGISNLNIITSGVIPPNPAELINSQRMTDFLQEVRESYDMILLDAPPILHVTDGAILGKKVDGTLMVYKAGDVPRTSLRRAVNLLRSVDVDLLGVVLNMIRADISTEYQDMGYSSYYGYGSEGMEGGTFIERLQGMTNRLRRWGEGAAEVEHVDSADDDGENEEEEFDEIEDLDPDRGATASGPIPAEERKGGRGKAGVASGLLLALVCMGLIWQSGYLAKPLGLLPVFSANRRIESEKPADGMAAVPLVAEEGSASAADGTPVESGPEERVALDDGESPVVREESREVAPQRGVEERGGGETEFAAAPAPFSIRVAAYVARSSWAERLLNRLREGGETAFLAPVEVGGQRMVRLLVGSFGSWDAAFQKGQQLVGKGVIEEFTIARMPYAVELAVVGNEKEAARQLVARDLPGQFTYMQRGADGRIRLLAGAFETEEEALDFSGSLDTGPDEIAVVAR